MNQREVFRGVLSTLEKLKIPYMVTGALAASFYGPPRSTHDLDLVLKLEWYRESSSAKHYEDVAGILEIQGGDLDRDYLKRWFSKFSLGEIFARIERGMGV